MTVPGIDGKVAIVTGARGGIGKAIARKLHASGAKMVLTDIEMLPAAILEEFGDAAIALEHDISEANDWANTVAAATERFGGVDILINNAAHYDAKSVMETSQEEFSQHWRVNELGGFLGIKAVIAAMQGRGGGSIVNISSGAGLRGMPSMFAYSTTKWAIRGMTRSAALDLAPLNIRVNSVHPGIINTAMLHDHNSREVVEQLKALTPLGVIGEPENIAEAVAYLASSAARFVTGSELVVDGGFMA